MELIEEYIRKSTWRTNANSNWNYSFSGLQNHIAGTILAKDSINKLGKYGKKHVDGFYHLHNLDSGGIYGKYCNGNDLLSLLQKGLVNPIGISSKPAKHFDVAIDHIVNFTYMMTQEFAGAEAWVYPDVLLSPFIYKDDLDYDDVKQILQRMVWNLSFPMRAGFQNPFSNITLGLRPSKYFSELIPIVGGEYLKTNTYSDFQEEIELFNRALLDVLIEGTLNGPFTFPLITIPVTKDFKWNNIDDFDTVEHKIFKYASVWGGPYFSNYVSTDLNEDDQIALCCRLRLNTRELQRFSGGIWNFSSNTGSLAVFTINMSRLGYLSNGNEKRFFTLLDKQLEDGKEYLLLKKEYVKKGDELNLFPMTRQYIGDKLFKNYFLTIGLNGLNECSVNFCGEDIIDNSVWCEKILEYMKNKVFEFQKETNQLFNFEATPGESLSYSLAKLDKEKYDDIFTQGTEEAPYYTGNSFIPYNIEMSLPDILEHQEKMQRHYTGGSVIHIDTGEPLGTKAVADLIRGICNNTTLPYITHSPTYGICPVHGKIYGKEKCCEKGELYSRVVGYWRPVSKFNVGKKQEFLEKKFVKSGIV